MRKYDENITFETNGHAIADFCERSLDRDLTEYEKEKVVLWINKIYDAGYFYLRDKEYYNGDVGIAQEYLEEALDWEND